MKDEDLHTPRPPFYVLEKNKVRQASMLESAQALDNNSIDKTEIDEEVSVSTVFLSIDHSLGRAGDKPVLFETMVFGGKFDGYQYRYHTLEEAQVGHQIVVKALKAGLEPEILDRNDPRWIEEFYRQYTGE